MADPADNAPRAGSRQLVPTRQAASRHLGEAVLELLSEVPSSTQRAVPEPQALAEQVAQRSARRAAIAAGSLALPSGPLGWVTVLPELIAVWRLQAQMVADIAALYGREATLTREQMVYCLFRHTAAQALRDLVARVGGRLVERVSPQLLARVAHGIGVTLSKRALSSGAARWLPVVGAVGVGAYAYYDTRQVARTAIELFARGPDAEAAI